MLDAPPDLLPPQVDDEVVPSGFRPAPRPPTTSLAVLATTASLAACGGGSSSSASPPPPTLQSITDQQASRFLAQASMGATRDHINRVQTLGYSAWLDEQFALPQQGARWDWLLAAGYGIDTNKNTQAGFDPAMWRKLVSSSDTLRQRVTLALSEILVVSIDGIAGGGWKAFAATGYADMLEANAFGTYRNLLQQVSTSPAMGTYLTFRGNVKANAAKGSLPDENYARELMQLFTLGLYELNLDGSLKLSAGVPKETYVQDDVSGLARVFTGWDFDTGTSDVGHPQEYQRVPMRQVPSRHERGAKSFLGTTIAANTDGVVSLQLALDAIYAHANMAPFISRQLIQRLVTSNPSAAYIGRVAGVFNSNGAGVKGDLKAVLKAVLLDDEARGDTHLTDPEFGKLREPMLRFLAWSRSFNASSPSDAWAIPNTTDPGTRLGQSPGRSPSVFNFFRPGYVPPNSDIGTHALVAPEFQITNESSVVGYVNYMQRAVSTGIGDVKADYSALLPLVTDSQALLDELNLLLAVGQLSAATLAPLKAALDSINASTDAGKNNRLYAALTLVLAAPEFITQK
ncbi:MAG: DUF1800 domain-containing protein [Rhizobacter sp.]